MVDKIKPLVDQFRVNNWLFGETFKGVETEQITIRPQDRASSLLWNAGHVVNSRYLLIRLLGVDMPGPWGDVFSRGKEVLENSAYPSIDEIKAEWEKVTLQLMERLENITAEELTAKHGVGFPVYDKSRMGAVTFLSLHESYHMGQFSYTRKLLGLNGLTG